MSATQFHVTFLWVNARLMQIKHSVFIDWKVKGRSISPSRVSLSVIVKLCESSFPTLFGIPGGELRVAAAKKRC